MKLWLLTKNRRGRRGSPRLSLFPFLAVLICTMGALVLLLLAVTRQARLQAVREAAAKLSQQQGDMKAQRDAIQWRAEQLKQSRQTTESQLADARLVLGHLEDHARRLRARLDELRAAAKNLDDVEILAGRQRSGTEEELRQIEAKVAEAERQLVDARQAIQKRPRSYSIIPYEGPNQTRRRPIYVECLADEVVLQPEGIRFTEADFDGPLGPGNPLATGLRAARERMLAQGSIDPQNGGEPYPLLLVRPRGIGAYYAARAAMKSWASEFGYELIGDDWQLQFPPQDSGMAQVVQQAVDAARAEQKALIAAAPSRYARRSRAGTYHVGASGVVREGSLDDDEEDSAFQMRPPGPRYGDHYGAAGRGAGGSGEGSDRPVSGGASAGGSGAVQLPYGSIAAHGAGASGGTGSGTGDGGARGLPYGPTVGADGGGAGSPAAGGNGELAGGGRPAGTAGSPQGQPTGPMLGSGNAATANPSSEGGSSSVGQRAERPDGFVAGRPYEPQPVRRPPSSGGEPAAPLRPGEWHESPDYTPPSKQDDDRDDKRRRRDIKSMAETRGRDWGLRNAASGSVATTRPIRVDCYPDRIILVPDDSRVAAKVIPLSGGTEHSIDKLIAAVWEYMDSWGIAGRGMYWKPILSIAVAPGAEQRFEELNVLLEGSGLTVRRKQ